MTTIAIPPAHTPTVRVTLWDRLAVALLGVLGFVLSYDALRQMAGATHVRGPLTYLFPIIIDGFIAYGVRALLVLREARWPARAYAWTLFAGATATSVWANALHAVRLNQLPSTGSGLRLTDTVVGVLSTLAPLALGGAVHLYILIARHGHDTASAPAEQNAVPRTATSPDPEPELRPERAEDRSDENALLTLLSAAGLLPAEWRDALPDPEPAEADGQPADAPDTRAEASGGAGGAENKPIGRPPGAPMERLLEVGRAAVAAEGRLTRAIVEQAVREAGLPLGSTRLTELMRKLREEQADEQNPPHPEAG
ncbi:DUF2637 domain-containing protein [Streptomyces rubellomurinus]|uniref:DUF2637 domain-containing protein n=1 Tax=Streptomyces rubellomurinus (strain ATCC 31215) TaxID=359131 RepID=UPI0005F1DD81|nr:DUF2637 domain-containing protein [Streptomyces rubellomurinus]